MTPTPDVPADDTHEAKLIGSTDCPSCGGTATTWWEVPLPGVEDAEEIYKVSCPDCGHKETW